MMLSDQEKVSEKTVKKSPGVPKIDFTLFTTGDGTVVSTKERIIKGTPINCSKISSN